MTSTDLFDDPAPASSGNPFFKVSQHVGALVVIDVTGEGRELAYKKSEETHHVYGEVTVVDGPDKGQEFYLKSDGAISQQLKGRNRVAGRLVKKGQAVVIDTPVSDADKKAAAEFMASKTDDSEEIPF